MCIKGKIHEKVHYMQVKNDVEGYVIMYGHIFAISKQAT